MRKFLFLTVLTCITAVSTLNVLFSYQIQFIIDALAKKDVDAFSKNILVMAFIMILLLIIEYARQYLNTSYLNKVGLDIHKTIISKVFHLDFRQFKEKSSGEYISILNNDIDRIKTFHYDAIISLYQGIVTFIIASMALFSLDSITAILIILVSAFPILIPYLFRHKTRSVTNKISDQQSQYNSYLKDFISGLLDIKNSHSSKLFVDNVNNKYKDVNTSVQDECQLTSLINVLIGLFFYGCVIVILLIGGQQVLSGAITIGALTSIIALSNELEMPINLIADNLSSINSVKDIKQSYDHQSNELVDVTHTASKLEALNRILLQNISYSINDHQLFKNFTYEFVRGHKYLIIGSSGKGKSTLAYLLTKNIEPDQGSILYNNLDSQQLSYADVQQHIALISQQSIIFTETLLNNLHLYQDLPVDQTQKLLQQFNLESRFKDLDELLIDDGNLSGGQKQRLLIIRALLQHKNFILLDESLSGLDKENYDLIESYLLNKKDLCVINISHRPTNHIEQYDAILNFDQLN
ncbi:ABC transporter ATP-binding protein [Atopobacter sp. AH10]|uniref:ABC transporter transmembrane domain-containing protein n=1 Tax=Atopobacter sp. AH10 TaxID=2315861 RepID=UPI000EF24C4B|nr:ABC transporter ATP-binding protein [Atopobacter sp. AH10]RLK62573.1 ABC transporter ATP-binding protein [Atopobacter sp. AH10]